MENTASFSPSIKPLVGWFVQGLGKFLPFRSYLQNATSVPYTYVFRDVEEYRDRLIEEWQKTQTPLDILIVGCATGQEAYSIGAVCLDAGVEFQMQAVDINSDAVEIARRGIYDWDEERRRAQSNDDTPGVAAKTIEWMERCERFFPKMEPDAQTSGMTDPRRPVPELRDRIRFEQSSLDAFKTEQTFDFIVCRKMIYYLPPTTRQKALERMGTLVREGNRSRILFDPYSLKQPFVASWLKEPGGFAAGSLS